MKLTSKIQQKKLTRVHIIEKTEHARKKHIDLLLMVMSLSPKHRFIENIYIYIYIIWNWIDCPIFTYVSQIGARQPCQLPSFFDHCTISKSFCKPNISRVYRIQTMQTRKSCYSKEYTTGFGVLVRKYAKTLRWYKYYRDSRSRFNFLGRIGDLQEL